MCGVWRVTWASEVLRAQETLLPLPVAPVSQNIPGTSRTPGRAMLETGGQDQLPRWSPRIGGPERNFPNPPPSTLHRSTQDRKERPAGPTARALTSVTSCVLCDSVDDKRLVLWTNDYQSGAHSAEGRLRRRRNQLKDDLSSVCPKPSIPAPFRLCEKSLKRQEVGKTLAHTLHSKLAPEQLWTCHGRTRYVGG